LHKTSNATSTYGDQLRSAGRAGEAATQYRQSLELFRQLGNIDMIAYPLGNLGRLALEEGRLQEAYDRLAESVVISRAVGNRVGIADWLTQFGSAALALGDVGQAELCYEEALALYQEIGNQRACPAVLADLGYTALLKRELAQSRRYLHESLSVYRRTILPLLQTLPETRWRGEMQRELLVCLEANVLVEVAEGNVERALTLFGAAASLRVQGRTQIDLELRARVDEAMRSVQVQLSPETWAKAWETGQTMSVEAVLAYALGE
jgi:tetratricopeptide (TPR) repeat protein